MDEHTSKRDTRVTFSLSEEVDQELTRLAVLRGLTKHQYAKLLVQIKIENQFDQNLLIIED